jgi:hypothetical protein
MIRPPDSKYARVPLLSAIMVGLAVLLALPVRTLSKEVYLFDSARNLAIAVFAASITRILLKRLVAGRGPRPTISKQVQKHARKR